MDNVQSWQVVVLDDGFSSEPAVFADRLEAEGYAARFSFFRQGAHAVLSARGSKTWLRSYKWGKLHDSNDDFENAAEHTGLVTTFGSRY